MQLYLNFNCCVVRHGDCAVRRQLKCRLGVALKAVSPCGRRGGSIPMDFDHYFEGASAAGIIAKLVAVLGSYASSPRCRLSPSFISHTALTENIEPRRHTSKRRSGTPRSASHVEALQQTRNGSAGVRLRDYRNGFVSLDGCWLQVQPSLCQIIGYPNTSTGGNTKMSLTLTTADGH